MVDPPRVVAAAEGARRQAAAAVAAEAVLRQALQPSPLHELDFQISSLPRM